MDEMEMRKFSPLACKLKIQQQQDRFVWMWVNENPQQENRRENISTSEHTNLFTRNFVQQIRSKK